MSFMHRNPLSRDLVKKLEVLLGSANLAVSVLLPHVRPQVLPAEESMLRLDGCRRASSYRFSRAASG